MDRFKLRQNILSFIVVLIILSSFAYSTSYQQFLHFDLNNPVGQTDSKSYVKMSQGNYEVRAIFRYRFIVPFFVSKVRPFIDNILPNNFEQECNSNKIDSILDICNISDKLSFYIVNFPIIIASAYLLFTLIKSLGIPSIYALIGSLIFLSSRITIATLAIPSIDSLAIFSNIVIIYCTFAKRSKILILTLPFLALSKDTSLVLILLPLLSPCFRKITYFVSLFVSSFLVLFSKNYIDSLDTAKIMINKSGMSSGLIEYFNIIYNILKNFSTNISELFTISGLHDLQSGYSLFSILAIAGFLINKKENLIRINIQMMSLLPIGMILCLISDNFGRIFFGITYPVIITFITIFIWWFWDLKLNNKDLILNKSKL